MFTCIMSIFFVFDGHLKMITTEHAEPEGHNLTSIMVLVFISPFKTFQLYPNSHIYLEIHRDVTSH
jgi:hypothetical protein